MLDGGTAPPARRRRPVPRDAQEAGRSGCRQRRFRERRRRRRLRGIGRLKQPAAPAAAAPKKPAIGGAELRNAQKELASIDRKLAKWQQQIVELHEKLAVHDQSDYDGLAALTAQLQKLERDVVEHEARWVEVSELIEG